ncbi:acetyltransferase [Neobacillus bataviensis]|uniref:acetyltransferase n=1 Tax=Neobacillus bataviensis TaxID=220685 RepID=UPI001CC06C0C|nr:acetyltransferase [Neobacillus bataviensis]
MEEVIIFGASGHANVIIDILEKQNEYKIKGIFVDTPGMIGHEIMGYPILGKIADFHGFRKGIVAIGDNFGRSLVVNKIKKIDREFQFVKAVHPSAVVGKNVQIGAGTVVVSGAIINTNTTIGEHCIINTKASADHDVTIGDFSTLAPGVTIGGNSVIGSLSTVSMGANVIQKIKIGSGTLIGAGSTVIRDIPDGVLAYGLPAKVIRQREIDEKYI